jgi:uroporphyrinogen decarboxylase
MGGDTTLTTARKAPLLDCLNGHVAKVPPMWMMRQAGRYLPEYRALRAEKGGFLELVYDSPAAAEITLQPLRRFALDAAILFSDILIVPYAMGQDLKFLVGEGPHLSPRLLDHALESLQPVPERLEAIYETVRLVKAELAPEKTFLGFAGSAWTVATYMVNGEGSKDQHATREYAYRDPAGFQALIDGIVDLTIEYLIGQIDAGVDAVQIFDSWSGSLAPAQFERWVIAPNARIAAAIHEARPGVPVIGFPKGAGEKLAAYARETGVDALGLDETIDPVWAAANIPAHLPVQGNLDPLALLAGGEQMENAVRHILRTFEGRPHIFNLGHGILQQTPIEHVHALLTLVKQGV